MARKKKLFVTGGSGFIGRNFIEQCGSNYDISAPTHKELELSNAKAVEHYLTANDFDVVLHLAMIGTNRKSESQADIVDISTRSFFNIAKCSSHFGKMIYLGSGAEYDKSRELKKVKEDASGQSVPKDDYGLAKYLCSRYIESAANPGNILCLRVFGCYGKYEDYLRRFVSNAVCRAIFDQPLMIKNKNVFFDYLYVNDLARIIRHFIDSNSKPKYKSYNATPDAAVDLITIAKTVNKVLGKELEIIVKNKGLGPEYSGDNSRLKEELGDFKFTSLELGIRELYEWYTANKGTLNYTGLISQ